MATAATITAGFLNSTAEVPYQVGPIKIAYVKFTTVGADSYTFSLNGVPCGGFCIDTTNLAPRAVSVSGQTITVASCQATANHECLIFLK